MYQGWLIGAWVVFFRVRTHMQYELLKTSRDRFSVFKISPKVAAAFKVQLALIKYYI